MVDKGVRYVRGRGFRRYVGRMSDLILVCRICISTPFPRPPHGLLSRVHTRCFVSTAALAARRATGTFELSRTYVFFFQLASQNFYLCVQ